MEKTKEVATSHLQCGIMLYAWQPQGHGQYSFFVAAASKEKAIEAVKKHIEEDEYLGDYETQGWETGDYGLKVLDVGVATSNAND